MADKVDTQTFSVPVVAAEPAYEGGFGFNNTPGFVLAQPSGYAVGQSIRAIVNAWTWRAANWGLDQWWGSIIIAYDKDKVLTEVRTTHFAFFGVDDYETYDVDLDLGIQPPGGLSGWLDLYCEGSPAVLVKTLRFAVPLVGNGEPPPNGEEPPNGEPPNGEVPPTVNGFPWLVVAGGVSAAALAALLFTRSK